MKLSQMMLNKNKETESFVKRVLNYCIHLYIIRREKSIKNIKAILTCLKNDKTSCFSLLSPPPPPFWHWHQASFALNIFLTNFIIGKDHRGCKIMYLLYSVVEKW